ncbi:hypothetical protein DPX16_21304 [Anabarilius grahami]|uniref:Uncharacterized protein n=1 Tax=Anabarilius grahami TaxID=495550 RepID=A0A3N0XZT9_ANAGA|nr:hypothetical protein DPX16_21304 [Anabarilius grahami]
MQKHTVKHDGKNGIYANISLSAYPDVYRSQLDPGRIQASSTRQPVAQILNKLRDEYDPQLDGTGINTLTVAIPVGLMKAA